MPFLRAVPTPKSEESSVEREGLDGSATPEPSPILTLARAASTGDARATALLLKQLAPRMVKTVNALMGSSHPDVDDAVQQSLIALIQALAAFRGECSPAHYASRIAVRTAVAARRRSRARQGRHDASIDTDLLPAAHGNPSEHASADRRRRVVRELLDELPEEQGEALALRIALGWSLGEVAQATGAPLNTVRSRLRLAKEALRRRIDADPALAEELEVEL